MSDSRRLAAALARLGALDQRLRRGPAIALVSALSKLLNGDLSGLTLTERNDGCWVLDLRLDAHHIRDLPLPNPGDRLLLDSDGRLLPYGLHRPHTVVGEFTVLTSALLLPSARLDLQLWLSAPVGAAR